MQRHSTTFGNNLSIHNYSEHFLFNFKLMGRKNLGFLKNISYYNLHLMKTCVIQNSDLVDLTTSPPKAPYFDLFLGPTGARNIIKKLVKYVKKNI